MKAELTYYIVEGVLVGNVSGELVHCFALSGGGGGSTRNVPVASTNNPFETARRTVYAGQHVHGGPIPPGRYTIAPPGRHPHLGLSAELKQEVPKFGRGGFFIHKRGPHGSDGCIVPLDFTEFDRLMTHLTASGGGTLHVLESMGGTRRA